MEEPDGSWRWQRVKPLSLLPALAMAPLGATIGATLGAVDPRVAWLPAALVTGTCGLVTGIALHLAGRSGRL